MEYQRTRDTLHVKRLLGHKRMENTLFYTQLVNFRSNEYHVKVTETLDETCQLQEAGFDCLTEMNRQKIFRKKEVKK